MLPFVERSRVITVLVVAALLFGWGVLTGRNSIEVDTPSSCASLIGMSLLLSEDVVRVDPNGEGFDIVTFVESPGLTHFLERTLREMMPREARNCSRALSELP
jgi:hypothetical protein